jgi:hypothetical protein
MQMKKETYSTHTLASYRRIDTEMIAFWFVPHKFRNLTWEPPLELAGIKYSSWFNDHKCIDRQISDRYNWLNLGRQMQGNQIWNIFGQSTCDNQHKFLGISNTWEYHCFQYEEYLTYLVFRPSLVKLFLYKKCRGLLGDIVIVLKYKSKNFNVCIMLRRMFQKLKYSLLASETLF